MSMEDVLDGQQGAQGNAGEVEGQQHNADVVHDAGNAEEGHGATTAQHSEAEKHVPLAALEAERKGRQDWKEKAIRFEAELEVLRRQQQSGGQQAEQQQQLDPVQHLQHQVQQQALHFSERMARKEYGAEAVDQAFIKYQEMIKGDPGLHQRVMGSPDPWDALVKEVRKIELLAEVGTDPTAYREKLRTELLAELNQSNGGQGAQGAAQAAPTLPKSLAGARSSASRSAPTFTGPTPFDQILNTGK